MIVRVLVVVAAVAGPTAAFEAFLVAHAREPASMLRYGQVQYVALIVDSVLEEAAWVAEVLAGGVGRQLEHPSVHR